MFRKERHYPRSYSESWAHEHRKGIITGAAVVLLAGAGTGVALATKDGNEEKYENSRIETTTSITQGTSITEGKTTTTSETTTRFDKPKDNLDASVPYFFPGNTLIFGDALVGNLPDDLQRVFDNQENTGAITVMLEPGVVVNPVDEDGRPNGLSARKIDENESLLEVLKGAREEMLEQHSNDPDFKVMFYAKENGEIFEIAIQDNRLVRVNSH